jgi:hypothetical protein
MLVHQDSESIFDSICDKYSGSAAPCPIRSNHQCIFLISRREPVMLCKPVQARMHLAKLVFALTSSGVMDVGDPPLYARPFSKGPGLVMTSRLLVS